MFDLTPVLCAAIALLVAVVVYVAVPYYKAKTTAEQRENIAFWAKLAVEAAEKIYKDSGMGAAKKAYVIKFLEEHGIKLDQDKLDVVIESAVLQMQSALAD